jgi:anti-sigma regulatory factor (Ser/Thr protein kinase)
VLEVLSEAGAEFGLAASTEFSGKLDAIGSEELADELVAALHEGLRLIARHTGAGAVEVSVRSAAERLTVILAHDGGPLAAPPEAELTWLVEPVSRRVGFRRCVNAN